jgi:nitrogen fixation/metabolism regulation signal transduction histidine kinase
MVVVVVNAIAVSAIAFGFAALAPRPIPTFFAWPAAAIASIAVSIALWQPFVPRLTRALPAVSDALHSFVDGDLSIRLVAGTDDEVGDLIRSFNQAADVLRSRRSDVFEKELLLDTILQSNPTAIVLTNAGDRVVFANGAARLLLADGKRLEGNRFSEVLATAPSNVIDVVSGGAESLFTIRYRDQDETFRFVRRQFFLNTQKHTLSMFERLTPELRRQELATWKRAIRTMNHELNNSIAPLSSLLHSARIATENPEHAHRIDEIYTTIDERLAHLRDFLEAYARFARLPAPRRSIVQWASLIDDVRRLYPFAFEGEAIQQGFFDRAQIEQVLINLLKNAQESGGPPEELIVTILNSGEECAVRVLDRGSGMTESELRQALLPFYSTKPDGTGLGLALSSEIIEAHGGRLTLQRREGGGIAVTFTLPNHAPRVERSEAAKKS